MRLFAAVPFPGSRFTYPGLIGLVECGRVVLGAVLRTITRHNSGPTERLDSGKHRTRSGSIGNFLRSLFGTTASRPHGVDTIARTAEQSTVVFGRRSHDALFRCRRSSRGSGNRSFGVAIPTAGSQRQKNKTGDQKAAHSPAALHPTRATVKDEAL